MYQQDEEYMRQSQSFPSSLRFMASFVSYIFHPLFVLFYSVLLLLWSNPFLFGASSLSDFLESRYNHLFLLQVLSMSIAMPVLGVFIMRGLNLISSLQLHERQERIGPYLIAGIFYMILFFNIYNQSNFPAELKAYSLGACIAVFAAFTANLFSKISMHSTGMGGFFVMALVAMNQSRIGNEYMVVPIVLICGLVGSSRLILGAHNRHDVYMGYLLGIASQMTAMRFFEQA